jgi:competence protein ComEA
VGLTTSAAARAPRRPSERAAPLGSLEVDRATAADWERLPGIGPALAARIVADRAAHGPFLRPEGLLRVRGIGPKTLDRLRPFLRSAPADSASLFAN